MAKYGTTGQPRWRPGPEGRGLRSPVAGPKPPSRPENGRAWAGGTGFASLEGAGVHHAVPARRHPLIAAVVAALACAACAVHEPVPAFRRAVFIADRGISIPLPPPSLFEAPHQKVDVSGQLQGDDQIAAGTTVHVIDDRGNGETEVELAAGVASFQATLEIDLTDNCLELWAEAPDGSEGGHSLYSASIEAVGDTQQVAVGEGCNE